MGGAGACEQVVAVVDDRLCTLAAVRQAAAFAAHTRALLVVGYRPLCAGTAIISIVPVVIPEYEDGRSVMFHRAAAEIAPLGIPWDFRTIDVRLGVNRDAEEARRGVLTTVFLARHLAGVPMRLRTAKPARYLRRPAPSWVVVGCDRRPAEPPGPATARTPSPGR